MRFAGRCTTLRIDRDVVAAERISSQATVVTTSLSFRHAHDDQTLFCCLNVLIRPVNDRQIKGNSPAKNGAFGFTGKKVDIGPSLG
jgi:hypothetical protein